MSVDSSVDVEQRVQQKFELHDSQSQFSRGVPWLATPVTRFVEVLNEQSQAHTSTHHWCARQQ